MQKIKYPKSLIVLLLALVMIFSMSALAMSATAAPLATITVENTLTVFNITFNDDGSYLTAIPSNAVVSVGYKPCSFVKDTPNNILKVTRNSGSFTAGKSSGKVTITGVAGYADAEYPSFNIPLSVTPTDVDLAGGSISLTFGVMDPSYMSSITVSDVSVIDSTGKETALTVDSSYASKNSYYQDGTVLNIGVTGGVFSVAGNYTLKISQNYMQGTQNLTAATMLANIAVTGVAVQPVDLVIPDAAFRAQISGWIQQSGLAEDVKAKFIDASSAGWAECDTPEKFARAVVYGINTYLNGKGNIVLDAGITDITGIGWFNGSYCGYDLSGLTNLSTTLKPNSFNVLYTGGSIVEYPSNVPNVIFPAAWKASSILGAGTSEGATFGNFRNLQPNNPVNGSYDFDLSALTDTKIADYVFYTRDKFTADTKVRPINMPATVTEIGVSSFYGLGKLVDMDLTHLTKVGAQAFAKTGLSNAVFGTALVSLDRSAFANCTKLTAITLPMGVTIANAADPTVLNSVIKVTVADGTTFTSADTLATVKAMFPNATIVSGIGPSDVPATSITVDNGLQKIFVKFADDGSFLSAIPAYADSTSSSGVTMATKFIPYTKDINNNTLVFERLEAAKINASQNIDFVGIPGYKNANVSLVIPYDLTLNGTDASQGSLSMTFGTPAAGYTHTPEFPTAVTSVKIVHGFNIVDFTNAANAADCVGVNKYFVNGNTLNIGVASSTFTAIGDYKLLITATDYPLLSYNFKVTALPAAPLPAFSVIGGTLKSDNNRQYVTLEMNNNVPDTAVDAWFDAVTAIKVNNIACDVYPNSSTQGFMDNIEYFMGENQNFAATDKLSRRVLISAFKGKSEFFFRTAGTYSIVISSTGYADVTADIIISDSGNAALQPGLLASADYQRVNTDAYNFFITPVDTKWISAISGITIDGVPIEAGKYSIVSDQYVLFDKSLFTEEKTYKLVISAAGYIDSILNQPIGMLKDAPAVVANNSIPFVGNADMQVVLSYEQYSDYDWSAAINAISVDGVVLQAVKYNTQTGGKIFINNDVFPTAKDYTITIAATGYKPISAVQSVAAVPSGTSPCPTSINWSVGFPAVNDVTRKNIYLTVANNADRIWSDRITEVSVVKDGAAAVNFTKATSASATKDKNTYFVNPTTGQVTFGALDFFEAVGAYTITIKSDGFVDYVFTQTLLTSPNRAPIPVKSIIRASFNNNQWQPQVLSVDKLAIDQDGDELEIEAIVGGDINNDTLTATYDPLSKTVTLTPKSTHDLLISNGSQEIMIKVKEKSNVPSLSAEITVNVYITYNSFGSQYPFISDVSSRMGFDTAAKTSVGNISLTNESSSSSNTQKYIDGFQAVYVNGVKLDASKYTAVVDPKDSYLPLITIDKSVFDHVGTYAIIFESAGYKAASCTQIIAESLVGVAFAANAPTGIYTDFSVSPLTINLPVEPQLTDKLTKLTVKDPQGTETVIPSEAYDFTSNSINIKLKTSDFKYFFTEPGEYVFALYFTGYPAVEIKLTACVEGTAPELQLGAVSYACGEPIVIKYDKNDVNAKKWVDNFLFWAQYGPWGPQLFNIDTTAGTITIPAKDASGSKYFTRAEDASLKLYSQGYAMKEITATIVAATPPVVSADPNANTYSGNVVLSVDSAHVNFADFMASIAPYSVKVQNVATAATAQVQFVKSGSNIIIPCSNFASAGDYKVIIEAYTYSKVEVAQNIAQGTAADTDATVTPSSVNYDKGDTSAPYVIIDAKAHTLQSIYYGNNNTLTLGTDYTVEGSVITFKKALFDQNSFIPGQTYAFTFVMNGGHNPIVNVKITADKIIVLEIKRNETNVVKSYTLGDLKAMAVADGDISYNISTVNSFGSSEIEKGLKGPKLETILKDAFNVTDLSTIFSNYDTTEVSVLASDGYMVKLSLSDVLSTRYYYPGLIEGNAEGAVLLPAFLAYNRADGTVIIGQESISDMNNPSMAKKMWNTGVGSITVKTGIAQNPIAADYVSAAEVGGKSVAIGATGIVDVSAANAVSLRINTMNQYYRVYYTISKDGTMPPEPNKSNGIVYTLKTYSEPYIFNKPVLDTAGTTIIKVKTFKVGMAASPTATFTFTVNPLQAPAIVAADNVKINTPFDIVFTDNAAWRAAITAVKVNDVIVDASKYTITAGKISFNKTVFSKAANYEIKIEAQNYITVGFRQTISGLPDEGEDGPTYIVAVGGNSENVTNPPTSPITGNNAAMLTDIKGHWAESAIVAMVNNNCFRGISANQFAPDATMSRGMFITILYRLSGNPATTASALFDDVSKNAWYADAISWACSKGIVHGVSETSFLPNAAITREQMAVFIYNFAAMMGYDVKTTAKDMTVFTDYASISSWALPAVQYCYNNAFLVGKSNNIMAPQDVLTRGEAAVIIQRFIDSIAK